MPRFPTKVFETGHREVYLVFWDGGDEVPIRERFMWFETYAEAIDQLQRFLKVKSLPMPRMAPYYFESHSAHVYNVDDNIGAVSVVKIPVWFDREES